MEEARPDNEQDKRRAMFLGGNSMLPLAVAEIDVSAHPFLGPSPT